MKKYPVTGLVMTFNGDAWLARTLASFDFCEEIVVVDSGSTDATLDIAKRFGARIVHRDWEGFIPQMQFALTQVTTPWCLSLDQDEWITDELKIELISLCEDTQRLEAHGGYTAPRRNFYWDRWMSYSGWYPDRLYRFFRLDSVQAGGNPPHYSLKPTGTVGQLDNDIRHVPYAGQAGHLAKMDSYAQAAAEEMHAAGRRASPWEAVVRAKLRFMKHYLLRLGFLDGTAGLVLAINSFYYTFQKYIRLAELGTAQKVKDELDKERNR